MKKTLLAIVLCVGTLSIATAQKLDKFGADLAKKSVMGKEMRVPYTDLTSYYGYIKPGSTPDEVKNGKRVLVRNTKFAKFKNAEDGIRQNIQVLLGDRYKSARLNAKNPDEQILMIARAGYTTTPASQYLSLMSGNIKRVAKKTGFGKII